MPSLFLRRSALVVVVAPLLALVATQGCNSIVGLSDLQNVDRCVGPNCDPSVTPDVGGEGGPDGGGDGGGEVATACAPSDDPTRISPNCGPQQFGEQPCEAGIPAIDAPCNATNRCIAQTQNPANPINLRLTHFKFWSPSNLDLIAVDRVNPQSSPKCVGGEQIINFMLQLDIQSRIMKVGNSEPPADGQTFKFSTRSYEPGQWQAACGDSFRPPRFDLSAVTTSFDLRFTNVNSARIARTYLVVWDQGTLPSIVPVVEASIQNMTFSADRNCIGTYDPAYSCNKAGSQGWTTGGLLVGKIPLEEADLIPIVSGGCQSLCAIVVDPANVDPATSRCRRNGEGKIDFGNTCVGGGTCKDAVWVNAGFSAHAVVIQ
jgi:hypothetical protein